MRPLTWIVMGTSIAIVWLGVRTIGARRARAEASPDAVEGTPARAEPAPQPPAFRVATPEVPETPAVQGLVHLRGRVRGPTGPLEGPAIGELAVDASDGQESYDAAIGRDGAFELHLPARRWLISATTGGLAGERTIEAGPGWHDVTVTLATSASIGGALHLPDEVSENDVHIQVVRAGTTVSRDREADVQDGRFVAPGLVAGVAYDVTISGEGVRTAQLRGVHAPADQLDVTLAPGPVLRGAVGFRPDGTCPLEQLSLEDDDDPHAYRRTPVDRNCTFRFDQLPESRSLRVSGSQAGWHVEQTVAIPDEGDPPPLCLNPPCRDLPPAEPTRLEVHVTGLAADPWVSATVSAPHGGVTCQSSHGCTLEILSHEDIASVSIDANGCAPMHEEVPVHAGLNLVTVACRPLRVVQGTVRGPDGAVSRDAVVRCGEEGPMERARSFVFDLRCPADETEIIYQSGRRGGLHRARLPPGSAPVLLDLTL